jgi:hypothetical protein
MPPEETPDIETLGNILVTAVEAAKDHKPSAELSQPDTLKQIIAVLPHIVDYAREEIKMRPAEIGQMLKLVDTHLKALHEAGTAEKEIVFPPQLAVDLARAGDFEFKAHKPAKKRHK